MFISEFLISWDFFSASTFFLCPGRGPLFLSFLTVYFFFVDFFFDFGSEEEKLLSIFLTSSSSFSITSFFSASLCSPCVFYAFISFFVGFSSLCFLSDAIISKLTFSCFTHFYSTFAFFYFFPGLGRYSSCWFLTSIFLAIFFPFSGPFFSLLSDSTLDLFLLFPSPV